MDLSRIPKFYKYSIPERLEILKERNLLSAEDFKALSNGKHVLDSDAADKMVENVIGVFSLPIGLGLN
ncbi:3-hydroxy-3-methylglutaryl-CoA reductase, partial [Candidatus Saccharibacteria bacterium]|nr:3-hydroxy-3-methylglutaryl-CoA reductase [Calditrichia bacterium]NIV71674.1 3-hydroxy-3-methylglutaryl-CoA reductase [Calditrichia bacterium]NIV98312.1 3-hydroxy-3-methylglutaryl-CoA reductase [Candidatus Saccharibacteria bacterium]NIW79585.1 3-hydroxy-3-methylglutaryl-CoA reductase [Calditrichia bacterium]